MSMKADYRSLCSMLGIPAMSENLLRQAFSHTSAINEKQLPLHLSNERLEFLGDAVLELAVSTLLFKRFPEEREGKLTTIRAQLVCKENLALVAAKLKLGSMLLFSRGEQLGGGSAKPAILADALEALIGAVYLELGFDTAMQVVERLLLEDADVHSLSRDVAPHQWKSLFQEMIQRTGSHSIVYTTRQQGADHQPVFTATLAVDGVFYSSGSGRSKQEAEQAAAREALLQAKEE